MAGSCALPRTPRETLGSYRVWEKYMNIPLNLAFHYFHTKYLKCELKSSTLDVITRYLKNNYIKISEIDLTFLIVIFFTPFSDICNAYNINCERND